MEISRLSNVPMKFLNIFQTTSQFFIKHCITLWCHDTKLFCNILAQHYISWTKMSLKVQIVKFLSASVKFTKFLMTFMKQHFSFKVCIDLHYNDTKRLYFFSRNIIYFGQNDPIKVQILRLSSFGSKLTKFLMSFLKAEVSYSSNFPSFFRIMTRFSFVLFWLKHNILLTKAAYQSANFQTNHCSH